MPAGQGKDAERFAAAVESGTPLGAADDADLARELEIVAMLRSRGAEFAPDAASKERAKQRLMAVLAEQAGPRTAPRSAPEVDAELTAPLGRLAGREDVDPTAETTVMAPVSADGPGGGARTDAADADEGTLVEPIPLDGRRGRKARHSLPERRAERARAARRSGAGALRRRVVLVSSAAAVAMVAIAGGGVLASSDALPGDSLYGVKRVAESAGLALTFDDASRARRHLEIAATRLSEVERLAARDAQAEPAPEVYSTAMDEFETATDEGSRMLLAAAESDASSTAADDLHTWAEEQSERLTELRPELPAAADADTSLQLLERLLGRTGTGAGAEGGDSDSRRTAEEDRGPSGVEATDTTESPTSTPGDEDGGVGTDEADEPSRAPSGTGEREDPQLLPDLVPDANKEDEERSSSSSREEDEDSSTGSESESEDEGGGSTVEVPLPLLPPVTLPPLLPGLPGITIG